jgi:hypothetical protein
MLMPQIPAASRTKLSSTSSNNQDNLVSDALTLLSSLASEHVNDFETQGVKSLASG